MPNHISVNFLIVGAGPTGLGAAYRLKELKNKDFLVIDSAPQVGGLATSFQDPAGFTWDIGGHVQFSHYRYFDDLMMKALGQDGWLQHERESWVWIRERFIPYPFQNNIRHLPKEEVWACLQSLIELYRNPITQKPRDFGEWILATFGEGLARIFMVPYNFKVWAHPPNEMSYEWIGERVAVTDLARVVKNVLFEQDDISWGPNHTFQFPKKGGTGAIWESVADLVGRDHIKLNLSIESIDAADRTATLSDGSTVSYQYLVNTMPLDLLVQKTKGVSDKTKAFAKNLKYSSSNIVGVGLKGTPPSQLKTKCWMYFPEENCPFYRVTVFSNYSPGNVPDSSIHWSLMAEVSESSHRPVNTSTLIEDVIQGLRATHLLDDSSEVVSTWKYRANHGYPTPFLGRNEILTSLQQDLESRSIYSRGRFGGWKYEVSNQDHSLMQGVECINRLVLGIPETTYFFPNTANANWGKN